MSHEYDIETLCAMTALFDQLASRWDVYPDQWTERQAQAAMKAEREPSEQAELHEGEGSRLTE